MAVDPKLAGTTLDGAVEGAVFGVTWGEDTGTDGANPEGRDEEASDGCVGK